MAVSMEEHCSKDSNSVWLTPTKTRECMLFLQFSWSSPFWEPTVEALSVHSFWAVKIFIPGPQETVVKTHHCILTSSKLLSCPVFPRMSRRSQQGNNRAVALAEERPSKEEAEVMAQAKPQLLIKCPVLGDELLTHLAASCRSWVPPAKKACPATHQRGSHPFDVSLRIFWIQQFLQLSCFNDLSRLEELLWSLVSYFVKCSVWVCLMFSHWWDWNYGFWGGRL